MITKPIDIIQAFADGVNEGSADKLISLYDEKAVLIPTFSARTRKTPAQIRDYFETLAQKPGLGLGLHDKTVNIIHVQDEVYALSGLYLWRFSVDDEILNFEARFSYIVNLKLENPILQHHSSQIPRTL
ncbi:DUF4440 domain-containing protein [Halothiobacillus sp.]|uniref:DUF4440 domain-containing protein n=1 Tax=Halothiobacillus sp. TaxID=1891311 RepID=UPI0026207FB3|nr:DUF4440 domain-containing protein [Halothiobacillus sp.]